MRLIDADDAKRTYTQDMFDTEEDLERVNDVLDYAPTVDAVVVTRCKDCRSYNKPKTGWCEVHLDREHPDDFCSYGKRKDGANG